MRDERIKAIKFLGHNRPKTRKIKITAVDGKTWTITHNGHGWEQYGADNGYLFNTVEVAIKNEQWLKGEADEPCI